MRITKRILPISKYKRPGSIYTKNTITIHSTGNNNSTAKNEIDYLHSPNNKTYTSYHYAVGDDIIYQVIPDNEIAYHSGNRTGNRHSIGIEMVHTGNRQKVLDNTLWLIEHLMKKHNIPKRNVVRHYDWVMRENGYSYQKNCPVILNNDGKWTDWKKFHSKIGVQRERSILDTMTEQELRLIIKQEIHKALNSSNDWKDSQHWVNPSVKNLEDNGISFTDKKYDNYITRGETIAIADRVVSTLKGE